MSRLWYWPCLMFYDPILDYGIRKGFRHLQGALGSMPMQRRGPVLIDQFRVMSSCSSPPQTKLPLLIPPNSTAHWCSRAQAYIHVMFSYSMRAQPSIFIILVSSRFYLTLLQNKAARQRRAPNASDSHHHSPGQPQSNDVNSETLQAKANLSAKSHIIGWRIGLHCREWRQIHVCWPVALIDRPPDCCRASRSLSAMAWSSRVSAPSAWSSVLKRPWASAASCLSCPACQDSRTNCITWFSRRHTISGESPS